MKKPAVQAATFLDRVAIAFLSGFIVLITAVPLWIIFAGLNLSATPIFIFPLSAIGWFTGLMAVLGFLRAENLLLEIYGRLWRFMKGLVSGGL